MEVIWHYPPNVKGQIASAQLPEGDEIGVVPQLFNTALKRGDEDGYYESW